MFYAMIKEKVHTLTNYILELLFLDEAFN